MSAENAAGMNPNGVPVFFTEKNRLASLYIDSESGQGAAFFIYQSDACFKAQLVPFRKQPCLPPQLTIIAIMGGQAFSFFTSFFYLWCLTAFRKQLPP